MIRSSKGWRARLAIMGLVMSIPASAGPHYSKPDVEIFLDGSGGGRAMGTLGGVRNSADNVQRLSCLVSRNETTSSSGTKTRSTSVTCIARDSAGQTVSCSATSTAMAGALSGASNDSLLEFSFDGSGKCTDIIVYESTSLERKR